MSVAEVGATAWYERASPDELVPSSTLAAGVKGGSAGRFDGTTGVNAGEIVGKDTDCAEGVDNGVAILDAKGRE